MLRQKHYFDAQSCSVSKVIQCTKNLRKSYLGCSWHCYHLWKLPAPYFILERVPACDPNNLVPCEFLDETKLFIFKRSKIIEQYPIFEGGDCQDDILIKITIEDVAGSGEPSLTVICKLFKSPEPWLNWMNKHFQKVYRNFIYLISVILKFEGSWLLHNLKIVGAGRIVQLANPPANTGILCGCCFLSWLLHFDPAPFLWPGKVVEGDTKPWDASLVWETPKGSWLLASDPGFT